MNSLTVRRARVEDADPIREVFESVAGERLPYFRFQLPDAPEPFRDGLRQDLANPRANVFVAEQDGIVVGVGFCVSRGTFVSEPRIMVHREHRRAGIGRRLMHALVEWAKGEERLDWLHATALETNEGSLKLCREFGFEEDGVREPSFEEVDGNRVRVMHLSLDVQED